MKEPKYFWFEEAGQAYCFLRYKDKTFSGYAYCHPADEDIKNKLTGETIAEWRALISYLKYVRDVEVRPQLKILNQLYSDMKISRKFNPKSYEAKMLYRKIHLLEKQLDTIKKEIVQLKENIKEYVNDKDKFHKALIELRKKSSDKDLQ